MTDSADGGRARPAGRTDTLDRPDGASLLSVRGLRVAYRDRGGERPVLYGVDLDVAAGRRVALVGESGSGKSTLGAAVIGLLPGTGRIGGGVLRWAGEDLVGAAESRLRLLRGREIGLVPQDPMSNLNPAARVGRQIAETLTIHGVARGRAARARAVDLMGEAGIPDAARRAAQYPHEFSGGMRQRVLIAIALACEPRLLIADEPTSALDVTVQRRILDHLQTLIDVRGTALLLITHDLGLAADRTDDVVVLRDGQVVERGPAGQILHAPEHEYTRRLVAAAPTLDSPPLVGPRPVPDRSSVPSDLFGSDHREDRHADPADGRRADVAGYEGRGTGTGTAARIVGTGPSTMVDVPALQVRDLVRTYRIRGRRERLRAVDGVSFDVSPGTTLAVVGESGSGKSTLARLVLGLEEPTAGQVSIDGASLAGAGRAARRGIRRGMQPVFQDPYGSLDPTMAVERLVDEPLRVFGIGDRAGRRARVAQLLDQVALPRSVAQRHPVELSGGQRQRVAIARALACAPQLLVCDEAVSALDVLVQEAILQLLVDLQRELGLTYLFITHDLAVVHLVAHDVLVLRGGQVVEHGPAGDVLADPRADYTRELLAAVPGRAA